MDKAAYEDYDALRKSGWDPQKHNQIRFNSGSESIKHVTAKALAARVCHINGYRVSSEVEHESRGEIDLVCFGHEDRISPIAIEVETSPTEEVKQDKLERYTKGTCIQEMYLINLNTLPMDMVEAYEHIAAEIGLEP